MRHHLTATQLSAYLDDELTSPTAEAVQTHVRACDACRNHLEGLRKASEMLRGMEARAVPTDLDGLIRRQVGLLTRRPTLMQRFEESLKSYAPRQGIVMLFALIVALAAFIHLYSNGAAWRQPPQITVVPPDVQINEPGVTETRVGSRRFQRLEGRWIEEGLESSVPDAELSWTSPEGRQLLEREPELLKLSRSSLPVLLRENGRLLLLRPAPPVKGP